jgi:hypothetical protein
MPTLRLPLHVDGVDLSSRIGDTLYAESAARIRRRSQVAWFVAGWAHTRIRRMTSMNRCVANKTCLEHSLNQEKGGGLDDALQRCTDQLYIGYMGLTTAVAE